MPQLGRDIAEFFVPRAPLLPLDEFLVRGKGTGGGADSTALTQIFR